MHKQSLTITQLQQIGSVLRSVRELLNHGTQELTDSDIAALIAANSHAGQKGCDELSNDPDTWRVDLEAATDMMGVAINCLTGDADHLPLGAKSGGGSR
jgi:hypothetical protein